MLIMRLATRNLFRQFRRNALSMVSIVMGVAVIVFGRGFQNGLNENMIRGQIDSGSGHVMLVPSDYPTAGFRQPVDDAYTLSPSDRSWLDANTVSWTSRIIATPRAIKGRDNMRVRLIGLGDRDDVVFPKDDWTVSGAMPSDDEVMMGTTPASLLGAEVGDVVTLETRTVDGAMNAMRYTVSGTVRTGNPMLDNITVFTNARTADRLLAADGRVTHVATRLSSRSASTSFEQQVEAAVVGVDARTWQDEVGPILKAQEARQVMFDVLGLALLAMAATGIANTVLMAAFERTREIGTLRSMGLQRRGVVAMFALEGFWMGVVGGFVGLCLSGPVCWYYAQHGIPLAALLAGKQESLNNVPVSATLYLYFSPTVLGVAWLVGVVVAVVASIYPALAASRISPAEAVRAS